MRALRTTHPLDRNVYLLNLLTFLDNALFVIPIIVVYYAAHKSVGFTGFLIGEAAFALVMVVMEVPSGYLSDIWRRKSVLWLAMAWQVVGYALLWLGDGLVMMVAAQSIIGIGVSLYSGTNTAMLYDGLLERGKAATFSKYTGQHQMYGMIGATGAALVGGFAYALQPDLPAMLTVIVMVIATAATWFLTEPSRHKQEVQKNPIADMVSVMKYTLHGHKEVACLILFMTSVFVTTNLMFWLNQRYWMDANISEAWFGVLMAIGTAVNAVGAGFAHRLENRLTFMHMIFIIAALPFMAYGLAIALPHWAGVGALFLGGLAWGMGSPLMATAVNKRVESHRRATILSVKSLVHRLVFLPLSLLAGPLADGYGAKAAMFALLLFMATGVALSFICMARHHMFKPKDT